MLLMVGGARSVFEDWETDGQQGHGRFTGSTMALPSANVGARVGDGRFKRKRMQVMEPGYYAQRVLFACFFPWICCMI